MTLSVSSLPILYTFRRCPYAMRARLALYHAKIVHEHREISLKAKPEAMLELSPKGTVPVLLLPEGQVLEESLDIMLWALKSPLSDEERALISENDTSFKRALDRYKYPGRYEEDPALNYRDNALSFARKLESRLAPFLNGASLSLSDMALFPFVRQFAHVDPEWFAKQPLPKLKQWLDYFLSSTLFANIMAQHPLWDEAKGTPLVINPSAGK